MIVGVLGQTGHPGGPRGRGSHLHPDLVVHPCSGCSASCSVGNRIQCKSGQVLFGLSLCVSCILVRNFKVLLAFQNESAVERVMRKIFLPYWIFAVCVIVQGIICGLWVWLEPPKVFESSAIRSELLIQCAEGLMQAFISPLALVCFGFAFQLPVLK